MTEAVKHPNVMVVIAVHDFGPGSTGLLKDLHNVCGVAEVRGGRLLVVMQYLANAWVDHKFFAKICFDFHLSYIDRADEALGFATNDYVIRQALHEGDWRHTEGVAESRAVFWADADWGNDNEDVVGIHHSAGTTPRERQYGPHVVVDHLLVPGSLEWTRWVTQLQALDHTDLVSGDYTIDSDSEAESSDHGERTWMNQAVDRIGELEARLTDTFRGNFG